ETVRGNMGKVVTDARLMPYSEEGKISGFKISEIKQGGVFSLIGLREGDVLVKVNDYAIDSPEKGVQLLTGLKGETSLTLDIIRNNKAKQLHYQIQ
ncbi:MAG: PDZ domain-containing protein, partial [Deltaproteobacteria bacterium]